MKFTKTIETANVLFFFAPDILWIYNYTADEAMNGGIKATVLALRESFFVFIVFRKEQR